MNVILKVTDEIKQFIVLDSFKQLNDTPLYTLTGWMTNGIILSLHTDKSPWELSILGKRYYICDQTFDPLAKLVANIAKVTKPEDVIKYTDDLVQQDTLDINNWYTTDVIYTNEVYLISAVDYLIRSYLIKEIMIRGNGIELAHKFHFKTRNVSYTISPIELINHYLNRENVDGYPNKTLIQNKLHQLLDLLLAAARPKSTTELTEILIKLDDIESLVGLDQTAISKIITRGPLNYPLAVCPKPRSLDIVGINESDILLERKELRDKLRIEWDYNLDEVDILADTDADCECGCIDRLD